MPVKGLPGLKLSRPDRGFKSVGKLCKKENGKFLAKNFSMDDLAMCWDNP